MDRRTFIVDTAGAMLWAAGWPLAEAAATQPPVRAESAMPSRGFALARIAVFDPSLEQGRRLAREAGRLAVPAFALEADADIGALWHAQIVPRIARHAALTVALRPADAFVLARLGAAFQCRLIGT